jgi:hypothetical protein
MGFRSLRHMQLARVHVSRAHHTRFVPSTGFDYPLDGLLLARAGRTYFIPAAPMGFTLRSVTPRQRYRTRFHGGEPTYCFDRRCSRPHSLLLLATRGSGPDRRSAVSGL